MTENAIPEAHQWFLTKDENIIVVSIDPRPSGKTAILCQTRLILIRPPNIYQSLPYDSIVAFDVHGSPHESEAVAIRIFPCSPYGIVEITVGNEFAFAFVQMLGLAVSAKANSK